MKQKLCERITVRLPYPLAQRLREVAGTSGIAAFVRRTIERTLDEGHARTTGADRARVEGPTDCGEAVCREH